ncbi:MAG: FHA domain-containing protein [Planctomycetaceae bacterium]|nr:FHA domain-containing protein [Planctomycetaceae bacterium]
MAVLRSLDSNESERVVRVVSADCLIGRDESCDIQIDSPAVSRRHARITLQNDRYQVEDLQSRNHTTLNGRRIHKVETLHDGDELDFAGVRFAFYLKASLEDETGSVPPWELPIFEATPDSVDDDSVSRLLVTVNDIVSEQDSTWQNALRSTGIRNSVHVKQLTFPGAQDAGAGLRLQMILNTLDDLRRSGSRQQLFQRIAESLATRLPVADRVAILVRNGTQYVVTSCTDRKGTSRSELCLPLLRHAMETSRTILFEDHWTPGESDSDNGRAAGFRQILVTPLLNKADHCFGAVQLDTGDNVDGFRDDHVTLLSLLGRVISTALDLSVLDAGSGMSEALRSGNTTVDRTDASDESAPND